MKQLRTLLLIMDGAALVGILVFSVMAAIHHHDDSVYVIGQIICAAVVLGCVLLLRQMNNISPL